METRAFSSGDWESRGPLLPPPFSSRRSIFKNNSQRNSSAADMYAAVGAGNSPSPGPRFSPLAFRNECGRQGCGHIFEYDGPNPLGNIQRLVREHSPLCRGQRPEVTQIYWGLSQQVAEASDVWDEYDCNDRSLEGSSSPSSSGSVDSYSYMGRSEGGTSSRTSPSTIGSFQGFPPSSTSSTGKKTSRSEAERRLALESDEWTLRVTPHEVDCRGCRRTIKLDRRSRYYPGLWEKHRDRCEHVSKIREAMEAEPMPPVEPMPLAENTSSSSSSSSGFDPTVLAPRKSYYRNV
ncbi:hypothetical protein MVEN_02609900 [Mycena venus]|uniref:Uncharacterized protein n=1 Tax=Mycena venus TaxID=2733690 RepID=A0A8H6WR13_9AGAR|nr:hypothetical protein MVEN_02609900 [Mycena venus]